jgi:DNA relaxase NicK
MDRVAAAVDSDELVTNCTSAREIKGLRGDLGWTVYIGSSKSSRQVRFYNKAAEQGLEGIVWTRCEIQHRDRHAQVAAQAIADGTLDPVEIFNSACDFRDPASDINVSRRTRSDWWADWLGFLTEKVSFAFVAPDKSIKQAAEWITTQVSTTLAMLNMADPENINNWMFRMVDDGFAKLDPHRRQKAKRFRDMGFTLA